MRNELNTLTLETLEMLHEVGITVEINDGKITHMYIANEEI